MNGGGGLAVIRALMLSIVLPPFFFTSIACSDQAKPCSRFVKLFALTTVDNH